MDSEELRGKGLVIEEIEVFNLGKKRETDAVSSQNPLLKFEIGNEVVKTEYKKHVGSHIKYSDSVRFNAGAGDVLTITALHRRGALFSHSKSFIGQASVQVEKLGATNTVFLKSKAKSTIGQINFSIKGLVPLNAVADLTAGKASSETPLASEASETPLAKQSPEKPAPLPIVTEPVTTHTTRKRTTTTSTVTDTAHYLHEAAGEEDPEAHRLIEAGKQKLEEDRALDALMQQRARQHDSLAFTVGNLAKLLLAGYIAILDVMITRTLEFFNLGHYAPRHLLGLGSSRGRTPLSMSDSAHVTPRSPDEAHGITALKYNDSYLPKRSMPDFSTPKDSSASYNASPKGNDLNHMNRPPAETHASTGGAQDIETTHSNVPSLDKTSGSALHGIGEPPANTYAPSGNTTGLEAPARNAQKGSTADSKTPTGLGIESQATPLAPDTPAQSPEPTVLQGVAQKLEGSGTSRQPVLANEE